MHTRKNVSGFTILEVLIVLAVSGVMFVIAAGFINGKQAKTSFTVGTNNMASTVQTIISEVEAGQFTDIKFKCTKDLALGGLLVVDGSAAAVASSYGQGTNSECVFLGKFLHVSVAGNQTIYDVLQIGGSSADFDTATSYAGARAMSLSSDGSLAVTSLNLTKEFETPQNINITHITVNPGSITTYGIGFMHSLPGSSDANSTALVYSPTVSAPNMNPTATNQAINTTNPVTGLTEASSASICLYYGAQYAAIDIGSNNSGTLSANLRYIGAGPAC
jgi:prepilin-type N-terminal cleavage/methylation domain-containing protein